MYVPTLIRKRFKLKKQDKERRIQIEFKDCVPEISCVNLTSYMVSLDVYDIIPKPNNKTTNRSDFFHYSFTFITSNLNLHTVQNTTFIFFKVK